MIRLLENKSFLCLMLCFKRKNFYYYTLSTSKSHKTQKSQLATATLSHNKILPKIVLEQFKMPELLISRLFMFNYSEKSKFKT